MMSSHPWKARLGRYLYFDRYVRCKAYISLEIDFLIEETLQALGYDRAASLDSAVEAKIVELEKAATTVADGAQSADIEESSSSGDDDDDGDLDSIPDSDDEEHERCHNENDGASAGSGEELVSEYGTDSDLSFSEEDDESDGDEEATDYEDEEEDAPLVRTAADDQLEREFEKLMSNAMENASKPQGRHVNANNMAVSRVHFRSSPSNETAVTDGTVKFKLLTRNKGKVVTCGSIIVPKETSMARQHARSSKGESAEHDKLKTLILAQVDRDEAEEKARAKSERHLFRRRNYD